MFGMATVRLGIGPHSSFCLCLCLWVTQSTKSTNFGSRYLVRGFSELDEIWQLDTGALLYVITHIGELWHGGHLGATILKGVKICNAFLVHR